MSRLPDLPREAMTDEQGRIHDEIVSGPRGRIQGPLKIWLNSPGLADVAQKLGAYIRFGSRLAPYLSVTRPNTSGTPMCALPMTRVFPRR
jgi:4-carboxymuconolactone decarboxylase